MLSMLRLILPAVRYRKLCSFILACFSLIHTGVITVALADTPGPAKSPDIELSEKLKKLDAVFKKIEEMRAAVDRTQFDFDALLDSLDFEQQKILDFVRDEIHFEAYPGLLRGPLGTLLARAGNSLDQAVFGAKLLKDAGFDARVKQAKISEADAARLLKEMFNKRSAPKPAGDMTKMMEAFEGMAAMSNHAQKQAKIWKELITNPPALKESALFKQADTNSRALLLNLGANPDIVSKKRVTKDLVEQATDYFWIEHREAASGPWSSFHPAFSAQTQAPDAIGKVATFAETVPAELNHKFHFQVFVDTESAGKVNTEAITDLYGGPTGNLVGKPISFMNLPTSLGSKPSAATMASSLKEASSFIPLIGFGLAPGAKGFDLDGNTAPPDAIMSVAGGVIKTVGSKMNLAGGALSDLGSAKATKGKKLRSLLRQRIVYTLTSPGGDEQKIERIVYSKDQHKEAAGEHLARQWNIMLDHGGWPEAYVLDLQLKELLSARPIMEVFVEKQLFPEKEVKRSESAFKKFSGMWVPHPGLFTSFELGARELSPVSYRNKPMVLSVSRSIPGSDLNYSSVDIVTNPRLALEQSGKDINLLREAVLKSGVWETAAENLLFNFPNESSNSAHSNLLLAYSKNPRLNFLHSKKSVMTQNHLQTIARDSITQDLEKGRLALVTQEGLALAWWVIDPANGQTVGMLPSGTGGGEGAKYATLLSLIGLFNMVLFGYAAFDHCMSKMGTDAACCYLNAGTYGAVGFGTSLMVKFAAATIVTEVMLEPAVAAFVFMEVQYRPAVTTAILMDKLPSWCSVINR